MQCPTCDAPLDVGRYEGQMLHRCTGCQGHFLEHQNLRAIERERQVNVPPQAAGSTTRQPGEEFILLCPRCQQTMKKFRYGKEPAVTVDQCPSCKALWLDAGELEAIQASFERWEDGYVKRHPSHQRLQLGQEDAAAKFAHSLEKPDLGLLLLKWLLSLAILLGPAVLLLYNVRFESHLKFGLIYAGVWVVAFLIARFVTFSPDMNDLGWAGGLIDRPFSYSDDYNRHLLFLKVLFSLPKFILHTAADTFVFFR